MTLDLILRVTLYALALAIGIRACVAALLAARRPEAPVPLRRRTVAAASVWLLLALGWTVYALAGFVSCENFWAGPLAVFACLLAGTAVLAGPRIRACAAARPALAEGLRVGGVLLAALAGFLCLELPYNDELFAMTPGIVLLNLAILFAAMLVMWFLCQRRAAGLVTLVIGCFVFGLANYFLSLFKGQTVLPSDVLALGTAAQVSAGYTYTLSDGPAFGLAALALFAGLAAFVPGGRLSRIGVVRNLVCGLGIAALLLAWYDTNDLEGRYGVSVDVWSTRDSYMEFGSVPAFLQRLQEVAPRVPEGYATQDADELQAELAAAWDEAHPGYPQTLEEARAYQEQLTGDDALPSIVGIMGESFSDLTIYPGVSGYEGTDVYDGINAALRGVVYTSVRGGGTCNSEFEFLCGASLGMLGGGVYPYMFYELSGVESVPKYLASLGYGTSAIHPASATNWRRDVVYGQLGFSTFLSADDFDADADTLRGKITDRETYDKILGLLEGADEDEPQFIFDVTLQSHGGYTTGLLDEDSYEGVVTVNGETIEGMSEYLTCIDASEDDLTYLVEELGKLDRKIILVFFGDHQPGFNDEVSEAAYGNKTEDDTLEQVQQRFETPYMVWANYDLGLDGEQIGLNGETSLNYLAAYVAYAAGLPLTDHQKALLQLAEEVPSVNLNGYRDAEGAWYWNGQASDASDVYAELAVVQYADLFDSRGNGAFDEFQQRMSDETVGE